MDINSSSGHVTCLLAHVIAGDASKIRPELRKCVPQPRRQPSYLINSWRLCGAKDTGNWTLKMVTGVFKVQTDTPTMMAHGDFGSMKAKAFNISCLLWLCSASGPSGTWNRKKGGLKKRSRRWLAGYAVLFAGAYCSACFVGPFWLHLSLLCISSPCSMGGPSSKLHSSVKFFF